jgi:hypothetical protein
MGQMFDQGTLTRADLEWAINRAYRSNVKRAAQRLLHELDQPTAPPNSPALVPPTEQPRHGARVVIAGEYLEEQETLHGWLLAYYIGLGVGGVFVTIATLFQWLRSQNVWITALAIIATIGAWIWLIVLIRRQIRRVRTFRSGRKGEDQVVEQLRQALDHRWTIYRNLQLPDRKDDLDLVLVGPGGVWTVQVKAFTMPLRFQAGAWEYQRGQRWLRCDPRHDPAPQVTRQATMLHDFLAKNGITRWVETAIALAESVSEKNVAASPIPVWLPFNITDRAAVLATRHPPTADELTEINALLSKRVVEQRAVEAGPARRRSRSRP